MPYIRLSVTQKLTADEQQALVNGLGEAMSEIPGKDGSLLIVDVEDDRKIFFGGVKQESMAWADVRYYSKYEYRYKKKFTAAAFNAVSRVLGTSKDRMCLTITEYDNWGALGDFRDKYYSEVL